MSFHPPNQNYRGMTEEVEEGGESSTVNYCWKNKGIKCCHLIKMCREHYCTTYYQPVFQFYFTEWFSVCQAEDSYFTRFLNTFGFQSGYFIPGINSEKVLWGTEQRINFLRVTLTLREIHITGKTDLTLGKRKAEEKFRLSRSVFSTFNFFSLFHSIPAHQGEEELWLGRHSVSRRNLCSVDADHQRGQHAHTAVGNRTTKTQGRSRVECARPWFSCHAQVAESS